MTINVQPEDMGSLIADLDSRIQKLESYPPGAMQALVSENSGSSALPWVGVTTDIASTRTPSFTVIRPTPLLLLGTATVYTSGGTAGYGYFDVAIENQSNAVVFDWFSGAFGTCAELAHTNGTEGVTAHPLMLSIVVGPGTYTGVLQYLFQDGATTTFTVYSSNFTIFKLGG